jgi:hypothetical protein
MEKNVDFQCLTGSAAVRNPAEQSPGNPQQNSFLTRITRFSLKYYSKSVLNYYFKAEMI